MRRKDRQITDLEKVKEIMDSCQVTRIAFNNEQGPYILPLNFAYTENNGVFTLYFHGAKQGRKYDLIEKNPMVGFEMDTNGRLKTDETACGHSYFYQSIIGNGSITILDNLDEKKEALSLIMKHATGKDDWDFPINMLERTGVFKLEVKNLSAKENV